MTLNPQPGAPMTWSAPQLTLLRGDSAVAAWPLRHEPPGSHIDVGSAPDRRWAVQGVGVEALHVALYWDGQALWVSDPLALGVRVGGHAVSGWTAAAPGTLIEFGSAALAMSTGHEDTNAEATPPVPHAAHSVVPAAPAAALSQPDVPTNLHQTLVPTSGARDDTGKTALVSMTGSAGAPSSAVDAFALAAANIAAFEAKPSPGTSTQIVAADFIRPLTAPKPRISRSRGASEAAAMQLPPAILPVASSAPVAGNDPPNAYALPVVATSDPNANDDVEREGRPHANDVATFALPPSETALSRARKPGWTLARKAQVGVIGAVVALCLVVVLVQYLGHSAEQLSQTNDGALPGQNTTRDAEPGTTAGAPSGRAQASLGVPENPFVDPNQQPSAFLELTGDEQNDVSTDTNPTGGGLAAKPVAPRRGRGVAPATIERQAADALKRGNEEEAIQHYRALRQEHPDVEVFQKILAMLEQQAVEQARRLPRARPVGPQHLPAFAP